MPDSSATVDRSKQITSLASYYLLGRSGLRVSPLAFGTGTFGNACRLPGRMHPVSRMILGYYLNNDLPTPKFRRLFSLPDSDLIGLGDCLVANYQQSAETLPDRFY